MFTHSAFNNFYKQYRLRQQIKGQFSKYISPDYVDMLVKDPSLMKLGGERREMSFLFADIVGFTPISEKYMKEDDPEGLVDLINVMAEADDEVTPEEAMAVSEFTGMISHYVGLEKGGEVEMFEVNIVPQGDEQIKAVQEILPDLNVVDDR